MKTVLLGERPPELEAFLARRRALGQDLYDEVWGGTYHVAPASHPWHGYIDNVLAELLGPYARAVGLVGTGPFNLGGENDYRVPDRGYHRTLPSTVWVPTAALVVEVISPDDETWAKFDFYAVHAVDEICTADPLTTQLRWFARAGASYQETANSALLNITVDDLVSQIEWPRL
jgi:Uma2 family endonuclease